MEDARRREEERLKAQQALFDDLDRRPQRQPAPQAEPAPKSATPSGGGGGDGALREVWTGGPRGPAPPAAAAAASPPLAAAQQQPQQPPQQRAAAAAPAGVYVPPSWNTRPPALEPRLEGEEASAPLCGCGPDGGGPGQSLFAMVGLPAPSDESFTEWFQDWFAQEYFPGMSKKLQAELVQRARSRSFLSGISSQVKKWAMANTDARLQADVWFTYFQNFAPPRYRTVGCVKTASMNLGSQAVPLWLTFWGVPDSGNPSGAHWVLPPWSSFDVDIAAVVDELDGRGGMSALLSSAM